MNKPKPASSLRERVREIVLNCWDGDSDYRVGDNVPDKYTDAILALLAQEVNKARIDELTLINARFTTVRGAPEHKEMVEGYMLARDEFSRVKRERITELERLG